MVKPRVPSGPFAYRIPNANGMTCGAPEPLARDREPGSEGPGRRWKNWIQARERFLSD